MKDIIVITGAASGMGREFLAQIIEKEKNIDEIWALDRDKDGLDRLANEFKKVVKIQIDLTSLSDLEKYKVKLEKEKPNIKILDNSAGFGVFDHNENISLDTKLNMIDLNIKACVIITDYSLPYMKKGAKIMNIASNAAYQPIPYINNYAATKSFVLSYSRALNRELRYRGVHVMAVTPFWTKTKFFDRAIVKDKNPVVIKFVAMYDPKKVMKHAIKDLYNGKDVSTHGFINRVQKFLVKIFPHSFVMWVWMNQQKYDGTPKIRKC